jgi:hypothetical protein
MATDTLILGGIQFDEWSTPHDIHLGGAQAMAIHKLPGGSRVIDTLGPDDDDYPWSGTIYGPNAIEIVRALDAMRISGVPVPLIWGGNFWTVIVSHFSAKPERYPQLWHYDITVVVAVNTMSGALGAITQGIDQLLGADMATAMSLVGL